VQSIYAWGPKFYCFVYDQGRWDAREVKAGPTNDKFFVIESGLNEGERVALNPRAFVQYVNLPKLPPEEIQRAVPQPPTVEGTAQTAKAGSKGDESDGVAGGPRDLGSPPVGADAEAGVPSGRPSGRAGGAPEGGSSRRQRPGGEPPADPAATSAAPSRTAVQTSQGAAE
jgi:hypothetical protein